MDETGLFHRLLPRKSYVFAENRIRVGIKGMKAKDRITLIMATNADGSHIFPSTVIGSAQNPRAFNLRKCPLPYLSQSKAWNDGVTDLSQVVHKGFLPQIRRKTSLEVALIMDNASSHGTALIDPIGQVKLFFLPPNCTSVHQPMDYGIIAAIKSRYKYILLEKTVCGLTSRKTYPSCSCQGNAEWYKRCHGRTYSKRFRRS